MTKETQLAVIFHYLPIYMDAVRDLTNKYLDTCGDIISPDDERILDILEIFYDICKR